MDSFIGVGVCFVGVPMGHVRWDVQLVFEGPYLA